MFNPHLPGTVLYNRFHSAHYGQAQDVSYDSDHPPSDVTEQITDKDATWLTVNFVKKSDSHALTYWHKQILESNRWVDDALINSFMLMCLDINTGRLQNPFNFTPSNVSSTITFAYPTIKEDIADRNKLFTSFFTKQVEKYLTGRAPQKGHWDVFAFDKFIIPVNELNGTHWLTAVIDFTTPEIRLYDSLNMPAETYALIFNTIRRLLLRLKNIYAKVEVQDKYKHWAIKVKDFKFVRDGMFVRQIDGFSCGVFTCIAIQRLMLGGSLKSTAIDGINGISPDHAMEYRKLIQFMLEYYYSKEGVRPEMILRKEDDPVQEKEKAKQPRIKREDDLDQEEEDKQSQSHTNSLSQKQLKKIARKNLKKFRNNLQTNDDVEIPPSPWHDDDDDNDIVSYYVPVQNQRSLLFRSGTYLQMLMM